MYWVSQDSPFTRWMIGIGLCVWIGNVDLSQACRGSRTSWTSYADIQNLEEGRGGARQHGRFFERTRGAPVDREYVV